jgi:hypothetical protein
VRSFLTSRRIELPEGAVTDPPDATTVHGSETGSGMRRFCASTAQTSS